MISLNLIFQNFISVEVFIIFYIFSKIVFFSFFFKWIFFSLDSFFKNINNSKMDFFYQKCFIFFSKNSFF